MSFRFLKGSQPGFSEHCVLRYATLLCLVVVGGFWQVSVALADDAPHSENSQSGEAPSEQHYTLHQLMRLALQNSPVVEEHQAKIERAQWQSYRARRAWTPKLESTSLLAPVPADADPTRFDENLDEILSLNIGPYFRQTLRLVIPIYTFGKISTAKELAKLGVDVAHVQEEQARQELLFQVQQAYFGLQLALEYTRLLGEGDRLIKERLEEMEDARDFGEAEFSTADFRRLQIFSAELDARIVDAQQLVDLAREGLRYLSGIASTQIFSVPPLAMEYEAPELESFQEVLSQAMIHRPEVQQLNRAMEARRLQRQLERRNFYPDLFVAADFAFGWSTEDVALQRVCRRMEEDGPCVDVDDLFARPYANPFETLTFGVAIGMNWRFDFSQLYGRYREASAQYDEVQAQRARALGAIGLDVRRTYREAQDAYEKVEIQRRRLDAARRWRDQFGMTLEVGAGNMKDAIDPLRAFYEAQALYFEAHHNYFMSRAALMRAIGKNPLTVGVN